MTAFTAQNNTPFRQPNIPFQGVVAGQKAIAIIPVGQTYLDFQLVCTVSGTAATKSQIIAGLDLISLKVNGVQAYSLTGAQAVQIADYYRGRAMLVSGVFAGLVGPTGILPIFLERPWMNGNIAMRGPAWGMVGQNSFQMEVTLDGSSAVDGIALYNRVDTVAQAWGRHVEFRTQSHTFNSTGQDQIIDLPHADTKNPVDTLQALHIQLPSGITKSMISNIVIRCEQIEIWNEHVANLELWQHFASDARCPELCPQFVVLDFMDRNWQLGELPDSMTSLTVQITWTNAPGTYNIIIEVLTGNPGTTSQGTTPAVAAVPGGAPTKRGRNG